jgi:hypothetical protein
MDNDSHGDPHGSEEAWTKLLNRWWTVRHARKCVGTGARIGGKSQCRVVSKRTQRVLHQDQPVLAAMGYSKYERTWWRKLRTMYPDVAAEQDAEADHVFTRPYGPRFTGHRIFLSSSDTTVTSR